MTAAAARVVEAERKCRREWEFIEPPIALHFPKTVKTEIPPIVFQSTVNPAGFPSGHKKTALFPGRLI
jgi:hypothetical protein